MQVHDFNGAGTHVVGQCTAIGKRARNGAQHARIYLLPGIDRARVLPDLDSCNWCMLHVGCDAALAKLWQVTLAIG